MLIGSNSNFFQQLSVASTAVATPHQVHKRPPQPQPPVPKNLRANKSSLAQAEAGKGSSFLGKLTDFIGALDGGGPSKRDIKKQLKFAQNSSE